MSQLFTPLQLGPVTLTNRTVIAPMCMYSADEGKASDWHKLHLGQLALSGAGLLIIEATAVNPVGRITYADLGLWNDATENALAETLKTIRPYSSMPIAIQLAHAGRKASTNKSWHGGGAITADEEKGWQSIAPSAIRYSDDMPIPREMTQADINELINDSVQSMDALITKANAKVNAIPSEHDNIILANKNALTGAIQNLLHNALQAMAAAKVKNPTINIQVYSQKEAVYISVQDNGPGINPSNLEKIFEPFFTSNSQGTGLGLAVAKSEVEAHQGKVKYLSKEGQGAHFCMKLPLLEPNQTATAQQSNAQESSHESS